MGYTGLGVVNDGERPAYDITIRNISLKDGTKLVFHGGQTERLTKSDGEAFYPAFLEARLIEFPYVGPPHQSRGTKASQKTTAIKIKHEPRQGNNKHEGSKLRRNKD